MPLDLLFNAVPHPAWVRSFMYEQVTNAVRLAVNDETMPNRSRMQVKVNFPEVNPAFDTYRVGTILEMVRQIVLTLTIQEGKRVRVCIQQSMGLGIFTGIVELFCYICVFFYLYIDSLIHTFGWSAFLCRIRFCDTLVIIFF
jgi:hypothetical protein